MVPLRRLLQSELLVLIGLLAGLSALLGWVGMGRSLEQQIQARAKESLARLSSDLTGDLAQVERIGGTVGRWWQEERLSFQDIPAAEAQVAPLLEEFPLVANLVFVSVEGWGLSMSRLGDGLSSYHLDARQRQGLKRYFRKGGHAIRGASWEPTPYRVFERPWWKVVREAKAPEWVRAYRFVDLPTHGISYVLPLRNAAGELQGAVCVDIFLHTLSERAWAAQPTPGSQVLVSDAEGTALILPKGAFPESAPRGSLPFLRRLGPDFLPHFQALLRRWEASPAKGDPFPLTFGRARYTCITQPLVTRGVDWRLSLAVPDRDFRGPAQRLSLLLLAAGLLMMGLATWRVVLLARRFSAPLEQLAAQARSLGEGEVPGPVRTRIQEFQTLGEALQRAGRAIHDEATLQGQLLQSQRVQVVGTLSGGIAHDVNNQLAAIVGQLDLGRMHLPPDHPSRIRMDRAEEAAHRCSAMVRSLLRFTHQTRHEFQTLDVNALVRDTAQLLTRVLGSQILLDLDLDPAIAPIQGDPVGLEQVIMNLAVNARDAMPGGGRLTIATARGERGAVILRVQDTGTGIPEAIQSRIFEPFFSTKAPEQGHGLGLAMVAGIVRAHGGQVEVESAAGRGTTVRIQLPCGVQDPGKQVPPPLELGRPPSLVGCHILVVEDDAVLSDVLVELFTLRGARVAVATDGAEGWRKLREEAFDLVICDQQMPHMTGLELLAELRKVNRELPVILVSGHGLEGVDEGRDPRIRILAKPFGIDRLLHLIGEVL